MHRVAATATGASREAIDSTLADAGGDARVAIVSLVADVDAETARTRLDVFDRSIARALEEAS